jgi:hypothetical protein
MTSLDMWLKGRFIYWSKDQCNRMEQSRYGHIIATSDTYWLIEEFVWCGEKWYIHFPQLFQVNDILNCDYRLVDSIREFAGLPQPLRIDEFLKSKPIVSGVGEGV